MKKKTKRKQKKEKRPRKIARLFLPSTCLGRWSLWLIIAFFLLRLIQVLVLSGQSGGETFTDNLPLIIPSFASLACAITSFVTGIIGIIWKKERAVLVFISSLIGLLVLLFIIGDITMPH